MNLLLLNNGAVKELCILNICDCSDELDNVINSVLEQTDTLNIWFQSDHPNEKSKLRNTKPP